MLLPSTFAFPVMSNRQRPTPRIAWSSPRMNHAGVRTAGSGPIMPRFAPRFLNEMNAFDAHAALGRLDHVVDGEAGDRHRCQRLHLDAGRARHLDGCAK